LIESLYAVIVNWNLKDDTQTCVESLFAAGARVGQVIVVDNGSNDGSGEAIQTRFGPSVHLIVSGQNLGFAGGCNLGINYAIECGAEWILLLNNDTHVAPDFLTQLEDAAQNDPHPAIFGPIIYYHDAPDRVWYFGDRLIPGMLATRSLYRGQPIVKSLPATVPVDFISGCCMLIRKDVFKEIGMLDPSFFMYGEEVDLISRARLAGFRLAVATRSRMWHKVSASSKRDLPASRYLRIRNQILFYRKYSRGLQLALMFAFSSLRLFFIALGDILRGQPALIAPLLRGWGDGWRNKKRTKEYAC
jgi:GT2 family glycosyltransferase